MVINKAKIL